MNNEIPICPEHMPDADVMEIVGDRQDGDTQRMTLTLDDNAIAHLARGHAIRVNFDREESK